MSTSTAGVRTLVQEVLASLPSPLTPDVIDDVCVAIEHNPRWMNRYRELSSDLRHWVVNNWIGRYVSTITGRRRGEPATPRSSLITSYSRLHPPE
jgi:hypothetical protein